MNHPLRKPHKLLLLTLLFVTTQIVAAQPLLGIFPKGDKPGGVLFAALVIVAMFTALALHELGHLLAGLLQGFRFELFVVGLLGVRRTESGIRIFLNKNLGLMGGVAATVPVTQSPRNKQKFAVTLLAGPVASLVFGSLALLLIPASSSGAVRGFLLVAGACSAGIFLATTLPQKSGMYFTDRARFQRLVSKGQSSETEAALLSIIAQSVADNSCRNISLQQARVLLQDDEPIMRFWGHYYEYQYYKDKALNEEAAGAWERLLSVKGTIPPQLWKALKLDEPAAQGATA